MPRALLLTALTLGCLAGACSSKDAGKSRGDESADDEASDTKGKREKAKASASAKSTAAPSASANQPLPTPSAEAPATVSAIAPPVSVPGRSPVPTTAEWDATKEVGVRGSGALGCETKVVREWLRIACRGKNDSGGTPTTIKTLKGVRSGEAFVFTGAGATSLVLPYLEGIAAEFVFSWTDKSHKLTLSWPKGAPRPLLLGVFEGAASPLDAAAVGKPSCGEIYNGDCERSFKGDCQAIIECSRGEPGRMPSCLRGTRMGPFNTCYKECKTASDCAGGTECATDWGEPFVCR